MKIWDWIKKQYERIEPLHPAFHTYIGDLAGGGKYRMHLRIEQGGQGILMINAAKVIHLNQTGTEFIKLMMDGLNDAQVVKAMTRRYKVKKDAAQADYQAFKEKIMCLVRSDEVCPVSVLDFGRLEPFSMPVSAPYRMDLALTHRCQLNCGHCYAGGPRETREMDIKQWKHVIDILYKIGIPHLCFTGGEATLRDDLAELIGYAEDLGLVTGLLTNGCKLSDAAYLKSLIEAGLDHVQITLESHDPAVHNEMVGGQGFEQTVQGIKNAVQAGVFTVTNTTVTAKNRNTIPGTIKFIHGLGVQRFAMNGMINAGRAKAGPDALEPPALEEVLTEVSAAAGELGLNFIWYTPTRYCELNPVEHGLGLKRCTAGHYNMCIEPDGSVLPCQSYFEAVGNILTDHWEHIWNHPLLKKIRERGWVDEECKECEDLSICGGGCPLEQEGKESCCTDSLSNF